MKRILLFAGSVILFTAWQESLEKQAQRRLQDFTEKNCPMPLNENIIMDSCAFEADTHTLHYYYRLMGVMDNDSTLDKGKMRELLIDGLRNETSTRVYKEAGYSFKYTYFSGKEHGKLLFETIMTKEDYQ